MLTILYRLNKWYDNLNEPWRFLGMFVLVFPPICALTSDNAKIEIRLLALALLFAILVGRVIGRRYP